MKPNPRGVSLTLIPKDALSQTQKDRNSNSFPFRLLLFFTSGRTGLPSPHHLRPPTTPRCIRLHQLSNNLSNSLSNKSHRFCLWSLTVSDNWNVCLTSHILIISNSCCSLFWSLTVSEQIACKKGAEFVVLLVHFFVVSSSACSKSRSRFLSQKTHVGLFLVLPLWTSRLFFS